MIYTAVLYKGSIVGEYSQEHGDFSDDLLPLYRRNKQDIEFYSLDRDGFCYFFLTFKEYVFSTITDEVAG